jgi:16S rRNA (guanine(966)-N(2))-methyltransferase RsmD
VGNQSGGTVRIISGEWRSRKIAVPPGDRTRPMLDRVKAAVFDTLGSDYGTPGRLPPLVVADVFAGGGTLGLEALSRGARAAVFIENHRAALATLRDNLAALHAETYGTLEAVDGWSDHLAAVLLRHQCTLILLDPPYRDARDPGPDGKVMRLLHRLVPFAEAADPATLLLHHPAEITFDCSSLTPWAVRAVRQYGTSGITWLDTRPQTDAAPAEET